MPNHHRGEIEAEIGGASARLVLTLGALAELEAAFGADDLVALAERFGSGRLSARDLVRIIARGPARRGRDRDRRGGGAHDGRRRRAGYVRIAAELIAATFGGDDPPHPPRPGDRRPSRFPGTRRSASGSACCGCRREILGMTPRELALAIEAVTGRRAPLGARDA